MLVMTVVAVVVVVLHWETGNTAKEFCLIIIRPVNK